MGCISSRNSSSSQTRNDTRRPPLAEREINIHYHQSLHSPAIVIRPVKTDHILRSYSTTTQRPSLPAHTIKPRFGEYRCICGRTWNSRLSWQGNYQICKHCKRSVHPHTQRELRPSDITAAKDKVEQHPKELCQKCQQLGSYCGKRQNIKPRYQQLPRHRSIWAN